MVEVKQVSGKREMNRFIKFPWRVYKNDPYWVPPLLMEEKGTTFNKKKHPFFEFGEAAFFLALREGKPVARVSAHINNLHNQHHKVQDGFFGFFEALDDPEAIKALFAKAEAWLKEKGATMVRGPENYTIYDEIGMLVDGWDNEPKTPVILETYNPPYYMDLMAAAGYEKEIDWLAFMVGADVKVKPVFEKIRNRLESQGFLFRCIDVKRLDEEVSALKDVVNRSWDANWGHVPYTDKQFEAIKEAFKLIMDPRVIFMVEYQGKIIATAITLPNISSSLKKMNGRLFPFGWWHFLRAKKKADGLRTFLFGVLPEFRNKGIDAVLVTETIRIGNELGYNWSDCSIIVENNHKIIDPVLKWGGKLYRTFRIFHKKL